MCEPLPRYKTISESQRAKLRELRGSCLLKALGKGTTNAYCTNCGRIVSVTLPLAGSEDHPQPERSRSGTE